MKECNITKIETEAQQVITIRGFLECLRALPELVLRDEDGSLLVPHMYVRLTSPTEDFTARRTKLVVEYDQEDIP